MSVTEMRYTFQKPWRIRMDISKPRKGAVLIYNPDLSPKVRVRPFPSMNFMVMNYDLTDKKVSSDSGGTIDQSHLGERIERWCKGYRDSFERSAGSETMTWIENGSVYKLTLSPQTRLPVKLEITGGNAKRSELFEWSEMEINPKLPADYFAKF